MAGSSRGQKNKSKERTTRKYMDSRKKHMASPPLIGGDRGVTKQSAWNDKTNHVIG